MASDFPARKLGDLCSKIGSGATPRGGSKVYLEQGKFALIRSQNVRNEHFDKTGLAYIEAKHAEQLANVAVELGDVLLNITGDSVARCCQVDPSILPARVNQHVAIIRPIQGGVDPRFLRYFLISPEMQNHMLGWAAAGATRNALTKRMIESFDIPVPDISEQRAIAHILGSLDDKIELNRRMNKTLEAMAQALFKSWFVDFDPAIDNALAAGNPIPEELQARAAQRESLGDARKPLPDDIRNLFPSEFEFTEELGWIPKGWEVRSLDQVADYMNGLACQKYPAQDDEYGLPVIKIRELRSGISEQTDRATAIVPERYLVEDGDILFSWSGSLLVKPWTEGSGVLNQHLFKVTSDAFPRWFFYLWTSHHLQGFVEIAADKATTMGHIKRDHLSAAKVVIPSGDILGTADRLLGPSLQKAIEVMLQAKETAKLRDILLPRLLSGEIRIPEAEKLLEDAA
jgi:type I restriction enzyme S subunit